jgi:hypothetical protein
MEDAKRPAVHVSGDHDLRPWFQIRAQDRVLGREAGSKHRAVRAAFEIGQHGFEPLPRRIVRPGVVEASVLARSDLLVRRRLKDGRDDRAGFRLGRLTGVNRTGRELHQVS